jgi:hypothetical protein
MSERKLITTEKLATLMHKHPETVRRQARKGLIPVAERVGREYRFDYVEVVEHFILADILNSLSRIVYDANAPRLIRRNAETMLRGLQDGSISVDQLSDIVGQVRSV